MRQKVFQPFGDFSTFREIGFWSPNAEASLVPDKLGQGVQKGQNKVSKEFSARGQPRFIWFVADLRGNFNNTLTLKDTLKAFFW